MMNMNIHDEELKKAIASVMGTPKLSRKQTMILNAIGIAIGVIGAIIVIKTLGWLPMLGIFLLLWSNNIGNKK